MDLQNSCLAKCFDLVVPIFCMGKMLHFFKSFEGRFDQGLFEVLNRFDDRDFEIF